MYVIKNALKCIGRSKGRNILIGIIVFAIAVSACIGLSIRQAAENAKAEILEDMKVTGTISFDRTSAMNSMSQNSGEKFDRESFKAMMNNASLLTLEEYERYASASSVKDFYYTLTASLNGSDGCEPVTDETETADTSETTDAVQLNNGFTGRGGKDRVMGVQSDFSVVAVSSEEAMTAFLNSEASVTQGTIFSIDSNAYECIITQELAAFNDISVGDSIVLTNPNNESEAYKIKVSGIYSDYSANEESFSMMGSTATDPANKIYMSSAALTKICEESSSVSQTVTNEATGMSYETAITGTLNCTYVFSDTQAYYTFEEEVRTLGLDESYAVSSPDITAFENSLVPLNTLSQMAGWFLLVILIIGALILIVLNIFNIRERKYEIGVLTAMGMKKSKVAMQFLTEIFVVTIFAVALGISVGAVSSVPVTNKLLENQVESQMSSAQQIENNFGRGELSSEMSPIKNHGTATADNYITQINSAMNLTVVWQMLLIAILLTVAAGAVSILFVMRYDPLKILANRD